MTDDLLHHASRQRRAKGLCAPASHFKGRMQGNPLGQFRQGPRGSTTRETMNSNGVVSIRVEALGVSITIADGSIAIEQTKTELPAAAVSKVDSGRHGLTRLPTKSDKDLEAPAAASHQALPESPGSLEQASPISGAVPANGRRPLIRELEQAPPGPSPAGRNGPARPPGDSGAENSAAARQTKPVWSDEEVEKLRALYPTHSASAIGIELGRGRNAVRSKAQNLGLKKNGPPTTSKPAKPSPKPRSLSAAVTADLALTASPGFPGEHVSLLDHHPGQCRWIISDVWPVMYCGAPVVESSSWCEQHSRRVFNSRPQGLAGIPRRFQLKAWP
jgi:hypothetical protein